MSRVIEKHSRVPRNVEAVPVFRSLKGVPKPVYSKERRREIIEDAKVLVLEHWTLDQIAKKHGIHPRTLDNWLSMLGDEYKDLRDAWLNNMLNEAGEMLESAQNSLAIAKAREMWKRATWYAERLDRVRYGQDAAVHIHMDDLGERLRRARERVVEGERVLIKGEE